MKKILSMIMAVVLLVGLLPQGIGGSTAHAATGSFFIFPNESYDPTSPHVVGDSKVTITGSYNSVNASNIKYSVTRIYKSGNSYVEDTTNKTTGLSNYTISNSSITVTDIPLFAGLNKVTFTSTASGGGSNVAESLYFEYHDGPTIYNLSATLDGNTVTLPEDSAAILTASKSGASFGQNTASISITGFAPNATKVNVSVNGGASRTASVSSSNNYSFTVAPLTLNSGKNTLSIQAVNGTQTLTTTRELTFYNGNTTFYDTYAVNGSSTSGDISNFPDFNVAPDNGTTTGSAQVKGKVVVPLTDGKVPSDLTNYLSYAFTGAVTQSGSVTPTLVDSTSAYMTLSYNIPQISGIAFGTQASLKVTLAGGIASSSGLGFTLRNSTAPYIYQLNYLSGYSSSTTVSQALSMNGTTLDGANIFSLPAAVEVLVANGDSNTSVSLSGITDSTGKALDASTWTITPITTSTKVVNVNGTQQTMQRVLIQLTKIPVNGSTKLTFTAKKDALTNSSTATVNILYGPYVNYSKAYDGQVVQYGQTDSDVATKVVNTALDNFKGKLQNVANPSDIVYSGDNQTVFFYINNTLVPVSVVDQSDPTTFQVTSSSAAYNAMFSGENTIKFLFKSKSTSYENTIKINLVPTEIPVIPYNATLGFFPFKYGTDSDPVPTAKDSTNFPMNGSNYTTKEAKFNVYGTFDFIDLGTTAANVTGNLNTLASSSKKDNYKLVVTNSAGSTVATWTLSKQFAGMQNGTATSDAFNTGATNVVNDLSVYYEYSTQSFVFVVKNQKMPDDGSPIVYTFTVYNSGDGGPTATGTMEIDPISATYEIVRPLTAQKTTNSNFIDVVINSKNATAVTINKEKATMEQIDLDHNGDKEFLNAYRIRVKDLKANKDTKIPITVTIGDNTLKDTVTVKYVPTNIPGAQFMQEMKNSAKAFDGDLQLKFPSGTNLIRRDADSTDDYSGEVSSGNSILYAIANSNDGAVSRYDIENAPVGVKQLYSTVGRQYFVTNFNTHFVKASDVYWIDPGIADDTTTTVFDPITEGQDPYQPATYTSTPVAKSFYERAPENELVPSKRGTMTLSYLPDMAVDAGKTVTVLYFDPELKQWSNIGGVVNATKRTITVPFDRFGYYVVAKLSYSYNDIVQHSYARNYMEALFAKGIMKATDSDSAFGANQYITRGEFVTAIVKALEIPLNYNGTKHFIDVSTSLNSIRDDSLYDFRYIETAARAGFVRGTQPQVFSAGDNITRQDAAVIIASATNLKLETDNDKIDKGLQKIFKDYTSIDRYARASVLAVAKKGYINGSAIDASDATKGYNFEPSAKMLRADTAAILARVMIGQKLLPKMS
ncbi:S-layer homology domain-containing protein [Paenibacillus sp. WLX2291]|uniref:S-layer homology domain-containing protein n=1 Tax=Paenibacillus sp. WLX2291 TaxID=3296934 RepID=UPI0039845CB4